MKAPPCGRVAAESLSGILRIGAGPGRDVDDAQLDNVTLLGAAYVDRSGADMHAEAFAGASSEQRGIHRSCAASIDALLLLGPQEHAFSAGIALHHALGVVVGMVCQRLNGDEVAGIDLDLRFQQLAEIAPMHGVGIRRQMVIGPLGWLVLFGRRRHLRCHQRNAARGHCRRPAGGGEAGLQERPAFPIQRFLELAVVQIEFRTVLVVTRAHRISPGLNVHFTRTFIPSQFIRTVKRMRHVSLTFGRQRPRRRTTKPRIQNVRLLLEHCVLKFEKHGHCLCVKVRRCCRSMLGNRDAEAREIDSC